MTTGNGTNAWLSLPRPNPSAEMRLFCFPYAGGGAGMFRTWESGLPRAVEVCPVHLPGRGARLGESPYIRLEPLLASLVPALRPYLDKPFAFFGHSMGALISFELARALRREGRTGPLCLFVAGRQAPPIPERTSLKYDLPEREFIAELGQLNGTPKEVLASPELMQLLIPLLRADFELCQTYTYAPGPPLDCPVHVFGGTEDGEVTPEELAAWRDHTAGPFSLRMLPGDHFFVNTAQTQLLQLITSELQSHLCRPDATPPGAKGVECHTKEKPGG